MQRAASVVVPPGSRSLAMTRILLVACILAGAAACDKAKELASRAGVGARDTQPAGPPTDLTSRPDILVQVFGEREDARIVPVAAVIDGKLVAIRLDAFGWRLFDSLYTRGGNTLTLYRDGVQAGTLTVRQGMWERDDEPLYNLPGCQSLVPMASVSLRSPQPLGYTVELLASTLVLGRPKAGSVPRSAAEAEGKAALRAASADASITAEKLESLQQSFFAINTGATPNPTIVATALEKSDAGTGSGTSRVAHVFAVADADSAGSYRVTFSHVANGPAATAEYRRYIDHLDISGDGVDELILEGWDANGNTFLVVLARDGSAWTEVFRGRSSWCLD